MADELQDKLNSILSDPDMMNNISSLAKSFGSQNSDSQTGNVFDNSSLLSDLQNFMNSADSDSRINLLNALRPYMRASRASHMDTAIKILKLSRMSSVLGMNGQKLI